MTVDCSVLVNAWRARIDSALHELAERSSLQSELLRSALSYVLTGGGKRLRGLLTVSVCGDLLSQNCSAASVDRALSSAVAIEALHAASLIHDDLPALDDDDIRRGKPSCHKAFSEATAILAGDALQGAAVMTVLSDESLSTDSRARIARILSQAWRDLCVGQQLDISLGESANGAPDRLEMIRLKTGALFGASVACGALAAGVFDARIDSFFSWGLRVGECFQALDDLDDGDRPKSERAQIEAECRAVSSQLERDCGISPSGLTGCVSRMILMPS